MLSTTENILSYKELYYRGYMQGASPINYAKDILILPVDKLSRDTYTVILKYKRLTVFTLTYVKSDDNTILTS